MTNGRWGLLLYDRHGLGALGNGWGYPRWSPASRLSRSPLPDRLALGHLRLAYQINYFGCTARWFWSSCLMLRLGFEVRNINHIAAFIRSSR